jgi:hypothetical protein
VSRPGSTRLRISSNEPIRRAARLRRSGDAVALEPVEHAFQRFWLWPPDRRIIDVRLRTLPARGTEGSNHLPPPVSDTLSMKNNTIMHEIDFLPTIQPAAVS